ncbi:integrase [Nitrobacteraceae bacterium AZCC 2146]
MVRFYSSAEWHGLQPSTQTTYKGIIERIRQEHGDKPVALLRRDDVKALRDKKIQTPAAANNWLRMMRTLMQYAIEIGFRVDDPTVGVKPLRIKSDGFAIWPDHHIEKFRAHHALGTRARLALELLYNTMQRRGDVVRMGRQHIRGDFLSIVQQKTRTLVEVPVMQELQTAIDATPNEHLTFIITQSGKAFSSAGFGNWFRDVCNEAGIPEGFSSHGLRKSGATRLADHGATDHEIMAWGGWTTLKEVQRYTKAANRRRNAIAGGLKLKAGTSLG